MLKYYPLILYLQVLLIGLSILTYVAYLQALQSSPLLASIFMILGIASGIAAFVLLFFAFNLTFNKELRPRAKNLRTFTAFLACLLIRFCSVKLDLPTFVRKPRAI